MMKQVKVPRRKRYRRFRGAVSARISLEVENPYDLAPVENRAARGSISNCRYAIPLQLYRDVRAMLDATVERRPVEAGRGRFAALLADQPCAAMPYDRVLLDLGHCIVAPTLGSILPFWLLVVPRAPTLNFCRWHATTGCNPPDLVSNTLAAYGVEADRAIWFEHGASESGSAVGCGADHAHLHIVVDAPFTFESFLTVATDTARLTWRSSEIDAAYASLRPDESYLIAGSGSRSALARSVEEVGSQFFRRVIAQLAGDPDAWDYRVHPHIENVHKTIEMFGRPAFRGR